MLKNDKLLSLVYKYYSVYLRNKQNKQLTIDIYRFRGLL